MLNSNDEIVEAPTDRETIETGIRQARGRKGLIIVNTGNGKGKSTAAFGLMTRAWGRKLKVSVIQFIKADGANFGEQRAAAQMGIDWTSSGDGFTWTSSDMDETIALARHGWTVAQERISRCRIHYVTADRCISSCGICPVGYSRRM